VLALSCTETAKVLALHGAGGAAKMQIRTP